MLQLVTATRCSYVLFLSASINLKSDFYNVFLNTSICIPRFLLCTIKLTN
jgi:hypothetical protein